MSDEMTELKRKLEAIERKTAIWRSQVVVLLIVFVVGWIASAFWMTVRLEARSVNIESRVAKVEAGALKAAKVVEAQAFVLKTEDGREIASLRKTGDSARLRLEGDRKKFTTTVSDNGLLVSAAPATLLSDGTPVFLDIGYFNADDEGHLTLGDSKEHHYLADLVPKNSPRRFQTADLPPGFKLDEPPAGKQKR